MTYSAVMERIRSSPDPDFAYWEAFCGHPNMPADPIRWQVWLNMQRAIYGDPKWLPEPTDTQDGTRDDQPG